MCFLSDIFIVRDSNIYKFIHIYWWMAAVLLYPTAGEESTHILDEAFECHFLIKIPLVVLLQITE